MKGSYKDMIKNIDFTNFLSENVQGAGYVRKILTVEELKDQEGGHRYGAIAKSHYYPESERSSVPCRQGDFFVISSIRQEPNFGLYQFTYYLVQVDFGTENNLYLLDCTCRVGGYDAANFPRPENIFVETLLTRGWFKPGVERSENGDKEGPEKEPIKTYRKSCPFCKAEHEQHDWLNIICPCGAKYYYSERCWLDRKTGQRKADL